MKIDHENFKQRTEAIDKYMAELRLSIVSGSLTTDKQIAILGKMFFERDKDIEQNFDLELSHVIRGFEWGMKAYRQLVEGSNDR